MVIKGNVSCKTITYLTKARVELMAAIDVAEGVGFDLLKSANSINVISLEETAAYIDMALDELVLHDRIAKAETVVKDLIFAMAGLNHVIYLFEKIGILLDNYAFDGHLYSAITALSNCILELSGIELTNEKECEKINTVTLETRDSISHYLCNMSKYKNHIDNHLEYLFNNW